MTVEERALTWPAEMDATPEALACDGGRRHLDQVLAMVWQVWLVDLTSHTREW